MNTNKKIAVVVMALSVILAVFLYGTEYSSSADPEQLADTLTEYIFGDDIKVQVVQTKRIDNHMLVLFTDERYDNFLGLARLKGGLNLRWRPIAANYGNGIGGSRAFRFTIGQERYVAICAVNIDPRIKSYEYVTTDANEVVLHSNTVSEPSFMDIYELEPGYWPRLRLTDSSGSDLAPELWALRDKTVPSAGVGTAEQFMINVFCLLVLFIGFIIARYYWTLSPQRK